MGSDGGNDNGAAGANSDPSSHSDYGGNYGGPGVSGGGLNSDPSSHADYGGNYAGESGMGDSGWSGLLSKINSLFSQVSTAGTVAGLLGLNPAVGIPATIAYNVANYAYNNPQKGTYASPPSYGDTASGAELTKPSVQAKPVTAYNGHPDWNSFLADINSRFRTRAANQPTNFTSLLED